MNIKPFLRLSFTLPHMILLWLRGISIPSFLEYERYTHFFRYFPLGWIEKTNYVSIPFEGKRIKIYCGFHNPVALTEIFGRNEYGKLLPDIQGKEVVDVGAAYGDTMLYFALRGAKRVYGYEIGKEDVEIAEKNIELNGLGDRCKIELCGIGKDSILTSDHPALTSFMTPEVLKNFKEVGMKSLATIVREHSLSDAILKIDTDGFEYEIIGDADRDTLRRFEKIIIEFHYGIKDLAKKLNECGFNTETTKTVKAHYKDNPEGFKDMEVGYLLATRE